MNNRIIDHPVLGEIKNRKKIPFYFNGQYYEAYEGETIAAALLANNIRILRFHEESGTARGIYCNIGHCFECRVTVNGCNNVRACITLVEENMDIHSGKRQPTPIKDLFKGENNIWAN
ncbi:(2Fe-2S)-binding protein [Parageobacillus yumthangensis]|jgi:sarcosine oxidase, subunit alpha|uniref:(2Fe-2S)-binding protein n=1 Tax=Geobacillus sp. ZGt-1 TaxID=1631556 RepID=UPI0009E5503E|nr:(2Fe-2S)-binding protein [Geobacillus sp. ZGt-1]PDM38900.1 (2Fe-2S)-binding protein [Parageobacillus yumthangensis]TXK92479.1 (2Fe-2S)-binding protein [Parageobacillus sp. SY1]